MFYLTDTTHSSPSTSAVSAPAFDVASMYLAIRFTDASFDIPGMHRTHVFSARLIAQPSLIFFALVPSFRYTMVPLRPSRTRYRNQILVRFLLTRLHGTPSTPCSCCRPPTTTADITAFPFVTLRKSLLTASYGHVLYTHTKYFRTLCGLFKEFSRRFRLLPSLLPHHSGEYDCSCNCSNLGFCHFHWSSWHASHF